ncbi:MAG TPA: tetratricopeptide repeat protein [Rhizomicrobium sp.]
MARRSAAEERAQGSLRHPRLREAARLAGSGRVGSATALLREHLKQHPRDAQALHLLGGIARTQGRLDPALSLLDRALESAPGFAPARRDYAAVLLEVHRPDTRRSL